VVLAEAVVDLRRVRGPAVGPCPVMVELATSVTTPMRAQIEIGLRSVIKVETIRASPRGVNGDFV
jgi:hypothetical protein